MKRALVVLQAAAVFAAAVPTLLAAQATEAIPAADTVLWADIGAAARAKTVELMADSSQGDRRAATQYRDALSALERGQFADAVLNLRAALVRVPNSPRYLGELAYALARAGHFAEAADTYTRAYQAQQRNGWFLAGLSAAQASLGSYADAAGVIQRAVQADSAVLDGPVAMAAAAWFDAAGDRSSALVWSRFAVARVPDYAPGWLRIATYLRAQNDTTPEGVDAIRRYLALRPGDHFGSALMADYLYAHGQTDSALALGAYAAQDTAFREYAAQLYLQAARDRFVARDDTGTVRLLGIGLPFSSASQHAAFVNILGRSQLRLATDMLSNLPQPAPCDSAQAADSLLAAAEHNLQEGVSFDSTRTATMLTAVLPTYRENARNAVQGCRSGPPPTPARRPARRRP